MSIKALIVIVLLVGGLLYVLDGSTQPSGTQHDLYMSMRGLLADQGIQPEDVDGYATNAAIIYDLARPVAKDIILGGLDTLRGIIASL